MGHPHGGTPRYLPLPRSRNPHGGKMGGGIGRKWGGGRGGGTAGPPALTRVTQELIPRLAAAGTPMGSQGFPGGHKGGGGEVGARSAGGGKGGGIVAGATAGPWRTRWGHGNGDGVTGTTAASDPASSFLPRLAPLWQQPPPPRPPRPAAPLPTPQPPRCAPLIMSLQPHPAAPLIPYVALGER